MLNLFKKSQFKKLESGKSFTFSVNFNELFHYGVYHKDLGIVTVSYLNKFKDEFQSQNFTIQEAKDKINTNEWMIL